MNLIKIQSVIRIASVVSFAFLTSTLSFVNLSQADDDLANDSRLTRGSGLFDHSKSIVRPDRLPYANARYRTRQTDADIARRLQTVSITPDGVMQTVKVRKADVELFKRALQQVTRSPAEQSLGQAERVREPSQQYELGRSVIGRDTRQRVTRTKGFPYRTIGHLANGCSGTLIGPRHVLTAGHCVFNISVNRWYSQLNFAPGRSGTVRPYGGVPWARALSTRGWTQYRQRGSDYAMVILQRDIGKRVGWMGFGWNPNLPRHTVNIVGYPGDKRPRYTMWASHCKLERTLTTRLYYNCDTYGGMSGSPAYVFWQTSRRRLIYGVHAYGQDSTRMNSATRITQTVFNQLRRWKATY